MMIPEVQMEAILDLCREYGHSTAGNLLDGILEALAPSYDEFGVVGVEMAVDIALPIMRVLLPRMKAMEEMS